MNFSIFKAKTLFLSLFYLIILFFNSCNGNNPNLDEATYDILSNKYGNLVGHWVQPNPINNRQAQGFKLRKDGTARSINMATLQYESWWNTGDTLYLVAKSVGNGLSFMDTTTYVIVKLNNDTMLLRQGAVDWCFLKTLSN